MALKRTLLDLASRGKYKTSADLPTLPQMWESYEQSLNKSLTEGGKNIFGQEVGPLTKEDLQGMVMGGVGGGKLVLGSAKSVFKVWADNLRKSGIYDVDKAILKASKVLQSKSSKDFVNWLKNYSNQLFGSRVSVPKYKAGGKSGRRGRALTPQRAEDVRTANRAAKETDILRDPGRGKRPKGMYDD